MDSRRGDGADGTQDHVAGVHRTHSSRESARPVEHRSAAAREQTAPGRKDPHGGSEGPGLGRTPSGAEPLFPRGKLENLRMHGALATQEGSTTGKGSN